MVKIVNLFGDTKIGRQGEVVYQRKYGEQMRRMVSPKRAIASQRQLEHRQLYRDALAWRKQLSRPNRRYLEGYCIANWIVDNQKIPLPWSRFALKLYLQKVAFPIIENPGAPPPPPLTKFESYEIDHDYYARVYGVWGAAQTFTPSVAHRVASVKLLLYRLGTPGIATVSIRETSGQNPTGEDKCSGTTDGDTLPTGAPYEWREITLGDGYDLEASVQYAIVILAPDGSNGQELRPRICRTDPTYTEGIHTITNDGGTSWFPQTTKDMMFQEWGYGEAGDPTPGLLHVRHPALLSVVHKRGGLTIIEYDNLSSLDNEYITSQVGLDILPGDSIEVTTLPGIEYTYQVS